MENLTFEHYQKAAVLRCASFLPTEGPSLTKETFVRALPFQKTARMMFEDGSLSEGENGVAVHPLARSTNATWDDIGFFYRKIYDRLADDVMGYLARQDETEMTPYAQYLCVQDRLRVLRQFEEAKKLCRETEAFLKTYRADNSFDVLNLKYYMLQLRQRATELQMKRYLCSPRGRALSQTLCNLLQSDCIPCGTAVEDLCTFARILGIGQDAERAYACAVRHAQRLQGEILPPHERMASKELVANVLDHAHGSFTVKQYIELLKGEPRL